MIHYEITYWMNGAFDTKSNLFSRNAVVYFAYIGDALSNITNGKIVIDNIVYSNFKLVDFTTNTTRIFGSNNNTINVNNNGQSNGLFGQNYNSGQPGGFFGQNINPGQTGGGFGQNNNSNSGQNYGEFGHGSQTYGQTDNSAPQTSKTVSNAPATLKNSQSLQEYFKRNFDLKNYNEELKIKNQYLKVELKDKIEEIEQIKAINIQLEKDIKKK